MGLVVRQRAERILISISMHFYEGAIQPFQNLRYNPPMRLGFPIIPAKNPTLESRVLPMVPTFTRPADAKETAIVCLSAALLFASLAVLALANER
jgi:hypothetical protein